MEGCWGRTYGLDLERGDGLHLRGDVVVCRLERLEHLLALRDDVLVLEDATVVLKVDVGLALLELGVVQTGVRGPLAELRERGDGLLVEAQLGVDPSPVDDAVRSAGPPSAHVRLLDCLRSHRCEEESRIRSPSWRELFPWAFLVSSQPSQVYEGPEPAHSGPQSNSGEVGVIESS